MKKLEAFDFKTQTRIAPVEWPTEIWSGDIIQLDASEVNAETPQDLASRRQALRVYAEKNGFDIKVNRGRGADGKADMTLVIQAFPKPPVEPTPETYNEETGEVTTPAPEPKGKGRSKK